MGLLISTCFVGSQLWSSQKNNGKPEKQTQKVAAKKQGEDADQQELKKIEESLTGLPKQIVEFDVDLQEKDFKALVKTLRDDLDKKEGRLKKLNISEEERARIQKLISESNDAIVTMISTWGVRQKALAEEGKKALELEHKETGHNQEAGDMPPYIEPSDLHLT